MLNLFKRAESFGNRIAIEHKGNRFSYNELVNRSNLIASFLLDKNKKDLNEERVAFLLDPDINYITTLWGIWKAGGVAVPLSLSAKKEELIHYLSDTDAKLLITSEKYNSRLDSIDLDNLKIHLIENVDLVETKRLPEIDIHRDAMVLYTSGTTSKPKGVVSTHKNIDSQILALVEAWEWNKNDHIPLFLPLHHIHGIINALSSPLYVGGKVTMLGSFEINELCRQVASKKFSVFTAVPTVYFSLIDELEESKNKDVIEGFKSMRLMMSGSAALAPEIHKKWEELTGQKLLERYGMTEIGMALSNSYKGERRSGSVGTTLPKVQIKLQDDSGNEINEEEKPGQILIKGPQVFRKYLNLEDKTKESFKEGWFLTGDVAILENGYYKILGRDSVDIIKTGGYKVSALEIEDILLRHKEVKECAVVGIQDIKWGEIIAVAIVSKDKEINLEEIKDWCSEFLSDYKLPRKLIYIDELPKNSMGKVTKPLIKELF
ncbi:MAG: acyl-CoA synthetase [Gammaproteobacteria bacterium]